MGAIVIVASEARAEEERCWLSRQGIWVNGVDPDGQLGLENQKEVGEVPWVRKHKGQQQR